MLRCTYTACLVLLRFMYTIDESIYIKFWSCVYLKQLSVMITKYYTIVYTYIKEYSVVITNIACDSSMNLNKLFVMYTLEFMLLLYVTTCLSNPV